MHLLSSIYRWEVQNFCIIWSGCIAFFLFPHKNFLWFQQEIGSVQNFVRKVSSSKAIFWLTNRSNLRLRQFCPSCPAITFVSYRIQIGTIFDPQFELFANPIYSQEGDFPELVKNIVAKNSEDEGRKRSRLPKFTDEEIKSIKGNDRMYDLDKSPDYVLYRY